MTEKQFLDELYIESIGQEDNWFITWRGEILFDDVWDGDMEGYFSNPYYFLCDIEGGYISLNFALDKLWDSSTNIKRDSFFDSEFRKKIMLAVGLEI